MKAYGCTSTSARVTLFMKLDLPTFGYPHTSSVRAEGSIDGSRERCWRTCSRYESVGACLRISVHMRPSAARFSCLQRYSESPYLSRRT